MKDIPDKSIDMILCDLPYGTTWAKWDNLIQFDLLWEQYNRISNGAILLFSTQPFTTRLIQSNYKNYKYTWYWIKNIAGNYLNAKRQPLRIIEEINVFNKHLYNPQGTIRCNKISKRGSSSKTTLQNYKNEWIQTTTNYPKNVLEFDLDTEKYHPTQKPVELMEWIIRAYCPESGLVLDNCCGSGSTCIGAIRSNRHYIGIELEEKYINIAQERCDKVIQTYDTIIKPNNVS